MLYLWLLLQDVNGAIKHEKSTERLTLEEFDIIFFRFFNT